MKKILLGIILIGIIIVLVLGNKGTKDEEVIKVGVIMPFSESFAWWGDSIRNSIELSQKNGEATNFEFFYEDSKCNTKDAVTATVSLKALHPDMDLFIVGCDNDLKAMFPKLDEEETLTFMVGLSGADLYESGFPVINWAHRLEDEATVAAEFAVKNLGARSLGIFTDNSNFGGILSDSATKYFESIGGKAYTERLKYNDPNPETSILKVMQNNPDAIYMQNDIPGMTAILKRLHQLGYEGEKIVYYGGRDQSLIDSAGEAVDGVFIPWVISDKTNEGRGIFEETFKEEYGKDPFVTAYFVYDGLLLLEEAVNKCGKDVRCIEKYYYDKDDFEGILGEVEYKPKGLIKRNFYMQTVSKGEFMEVE